MAWTSPSKTWIVGEVVTAAQLNQYLRDQLAAIAAIGDYKFKCDVSAGYGVEHLVDGAWLECNAAQVSRTGYPDWKGYMDARKVAYVGSVTCNAITNTATQLYLLAAYPAGWPTDGRTFEILIGSEVLLVTAGFGTQTLTVSRGVEGSSPAAHAYGSSVSCPLQYPFGAGNGVTTLQVPDAFGGRALLSVGSNAAVSALGRADGVTAANRRGGLHQHTPHSHAEHVQTVYTGAGGTGWPANRGYHMDWGESGGGDVVLKYTFDQYRLTSNDGGSGVGSDPVDGGAFQVGGIWCVKVKP